MKTKDEEVKKVTNIEPYVKGISGFKPKPINVYDLDGNYLSTYPSQKQAAKELNISVHGIGRCIRGISKRYGKYQFRTAK